MNTRVAQKVAEFCQKHILLAPKDKIVVGVSGGPDSLCLLHLLHNLRAELELNLIIAHLNHQLRGRASQTDEAFVRHIAAHWRLPIRVETCNIAVLAGERHQSLEEAARQLRYAFLWRVATEVGAEKIAVGHNADDQVETVLMHFLRGTGLTGLRGMLPGTDIAGLRLNPDDIPIAGSATQLIRPLLPLSRIEIETYCQENGLNPRQDNSNQDMTFFRNRLRHELIPYLETYNPNIRQVIQHMAQVVTAETEILTNHLEKAWPIVLKSETPECIEFDLPTWLTLPLALKRSTLRLAVHRLRRSLRDIDFEHIETAIKIVEKGETGAKATLPQRLVLRVGYETFTIAPEGMASPIPASMPHLAQDQVVHLNLPGVNYLPDTNWQLRAEMLPRDNLDDQQLNQMGRWEAYLDAEIVGAAPILRTRQPGDVFCPLGLEGHRKKVNEFMINEKIPANWRNHMPLLATNGLILWVCGYRPDERACIRSTTQQVIHLKFEQRLGSSTLY